MWFIWLLKTSELDHKQTYPVQKDKANLKIQIMSQPAQCNLVENNCVATLGKKGEPCEWL